MTRLLVVDDEPQILRALAITLTAHGYEVAIAATGEEAIQAAVKDHPDAVIVDLGLPGLTGLDVIEALRGWTSVPIVVLSVRNTETDKIQALDLGADDYVTKPFAVGELLARLRAALRRVLPIEIEPIITTAHFIVDLPDKRVRQPDGEPIHLTPTQWKLLEILVHNPDRLVTHRQLLSDVWGPDYHDETGYLRVHINHLRRKLEPTPSQPRYITTEPGMGYRFNPTPERNR